jgi:hypothetical protein
MQLIEIIKELEALKKTYLFINRLLTENILASPVFYAKNYNKEFPDKFVTITVEEFLTLQYNIASGTISLMS